MEPSQEAPVRDMCCVFTDIIDSTNLWDYNEQAMEQAIIMHDTIIRAELVRSNGYEVKTLGDGFLASFFDPESALQFCLAAQKTLQATQWPPEIFDYGLQSAYWAGESDLNRRRGLQVRMGIHFGIPFSCRVNQVTGRMDYYGTMVNVTSRVLGEAAGDQIAITDNFIIELHRRRTGEIITMDSLTDRTRARITESEIEAGEFEVRSKGLRALKGLYKPEHVFLILLRR